MSSIFDALKKIEDEKSVQKSANVGGDLFQPPQRGGGRFRGIAGGVVIVVIMAAGAYYLLGGDGEGEAPGEGAAPPAADRLAVAERVQTPVAAPEPPARTLQETAPAALTSPEEAPAVAPTLSPSRPIMNEEQIRARMKLPKRIADLRTGQGVEGADTPSPEEVPVVAGSPTPPLLREDLLEAAIARAKAAAERAETATVPSLPAPLETDQADPPAPTPVKTVPGQAAPAPEPILLARPQPPEVPEEEVPVVSPREAPATGDRYALTPERPPLVKSQIPMLMVTEVTYHRRPEQRSARIRLGEAKPRLVREGDRYQGLEVKEIMAGAITLEVAGSDVDVDVGESLSFTVNEPDFH